MKIAISGKGGVGKTTLAAALIKYYAKQGKKVFAVDADPDGNLASALGLDDKDVQKIIPISRMKDLIFERTGAKPGTVGGYFSLTPEVSDIPDNYSLKVGSINLLVLGTVEKGGMGCICPESSVLKALLRNLILQRDETLIMDMEAGIEHLGRATSGAVDAMIVVLEPGKRSVQTAGSVVKLAGDIGIKNIFAVINKVRNIDEVKIISDLIKEMDIIGVIDENEAVRKSDLSGKTEIESTQFTDQIDEIAKKLEKYLSLKAN